jgi:hypothetical protein
MPMFLQIMTLKKINIRKKKLQFWPSTLVILCNFIQGEFEQINNLLVMRNAAFLFDALLERYEKIAHK